MRERVPDLLSGTVPEPKERLTMPTAKPPFEMPKEIWSIIPKPAQGWLQGLHRGVLIRGWTPPKSQGDISYPGSTGFQAAEKLLASNEANLTTWHNTPGMSLVDMAKALKSTGGVSVYDQLTLDEQRLLEQISADPVQSQAIKDATKDFLAAAQAAGGIVEMPAKTTSSGSVSWKLPIDCAVMDASQAHSVEVKSTTVRGKTRVSITPSPRAARFP